MTDDIDTNGVTVETGENYAGEPTIKNVDEIAAVFEGEGWLAPNGETVPFTVENPHLNDDPTYLRIRGHRSALWFHVYEAVREMGLEVNDTWQGTREREDDLLCIKVEPREGLVDIDESGEYTNVSVNGTMVASVSEEHDEVCLYHPDSDEPVSTYDIPEECDDGVYL